MSSDLIKWTIHFEFGIDLSPFTIAFTQYDQNLKITGLFSITIIKGYLRQQRLFEYSQLKSTGSKLNVFRKYDRLYISWRSYCKPGRKYFEIPDLLVILRNKLI